MYLQELQILQFKNIKSKHFSFDKKINCFVGKNGIGKTNILDAIYYLGFGRSYFNAVALQNIAHNEDFFMIDGKFLKNDIVEHIVCSLKKGQKKIIKRNGKIYQKLSEHLGQLPMVMISPSDQDLISEGSEVRRKFIDNVISQQNPIYLKQLIQYQKIITQRNALLKHFALHHTFDAETLLVYNQQAHDLGSSIFEVRKNFLEVFIPIFKEFHQKITNNKEQVKLEYQSTLFEIPLLDSLENNLSKDRALQYTSTGIHKDDFIFTLEGYPLKKYGSQGQQKSFLIALKLAQFNFIKKQNKVLPILLFDDIFDKLDADRVKQIIEMVNLDTFGQLFISDTHQDRTEFIAQSTGLDYQIFSI